MRNLDSVKEQRMIWEQRQKARQLITLLDDGKNRSLCDFGFERPI